MFIGTVTESGQLALTVTAGVGAAAYYSHGIKAAAQPVRAFVHFVLFILLAFAPNLGLGGWAFFVLAAVAAWPVAVGAAGALRTAWNEHAPPALAARAIWNYLLPLLLAALLANLKRGPWIGVIAGTSLFLLLYRPRLLVPALALAAILLLGVPPLRSRLSHSAEDFYISGGRSIMWRIGAELAARHPLGIGYANSKYLRRFSPEIPPEHEHFHNNFLNVLVETGWVSFAVFLWWLARICRAAFRRPYASPERLLASGIGCAVIAMMAAGMVEYNFGDSEVCLILFVLLGLLSGMERAEATQGAAGSL